MLGRATLERAPNPLIEGGALHCRQFMPARILA
jgi:hypothetical protein